MFNINSTLISSTALFNVNVLNNNHSVGNLLVVFTVDVRWHEHAAREIDPCHQPDPPRKDGREDERREECQEEETRVVDEAEGRRCLQVGLVNVQRNAEQRS